MRGTVSGAFWGLVLGTSGLAVASLVNEQPGAANTPQMPQITVPQPVGFDPALGRLIPNTADTSFDTGTDAPRLTPPAAPVAPAFVDTAPATPPVVINDEPPQTAPAADIADNGAITAPAGDGRVVTGGAMTPPPMSDDARAATEPPEVDATPTLVPEQMPETTAPAIAAPRLNDDTPADATDAPGGPVVVTQTPVGGAKDATPPAPLDNPDVEQLVPAPQVVAETTVPTTTLPQVSSGVRINRPGADAPAAVGTPSEIAPPEDAPEDTPALLRYAAAFENPDDLPMLGVVLLDDGTTSDLAARLADLPFPVTIILDPLQPGIDQRMTAYRDAGAEIGLQVALPFGARAQDVEVAFQAAFAMVPESAVLFSGGADLLQSDRAVTGQVLAVLAAEGLGLVLVESGLNNVTRQAGTAGVPAATVLRDLGGSDAMAASRALDQAAFRARQGQGEGVVVTAPLTADTLTQLADWARANSGDQITLAPASAILSPR